MKTINVTFEDKEFEQLESVKQESKCESWRSFILHFIEGSKCKKQ